jgi:hypothetical protein
MLNRDEIHAAFGPEKIMFVTASPPGYYVVTPCEDEHGHVCEASRDPVIAWALSETGCSYPVTLDYGLEQKGDPAILCPDGQVRSFGIDWENLADWLDDKKAKVRHG